jgi:hypothetical protein
MHTAPMPDSAGDFKDWKESPTKHHSCGGAVLYRTWESSCGGYEDVQYHCEKCGKRWWVEGPDA